MSTTLRGEIASILANDAGLQTQGLGPMDVYGSTVDTPPNRPFLVLRWGTTTRGMGTTNRRTLTVWVYDQPNDYHRIDLMVKRIKEIFRELEGTVYEWGSITTIEWEQDSDDGEDDVYGTILRTSQYSILATGE